MTRLKFKHSAQSPKEQEVEKGPLEAELDEALKESEKTLEPGPQSEPHESEVVDNGVDSNEDLPLLKLKKGSFEEESTSEDDGDSLNLKLREEKSETNSENLAVEKEEPESIVSKVDGVKEGLDLKLMDSDSGKQGKEGPGLGSNRKRRVNKYFYKVSNHHELFKIGRSFHKDYMAGVKSFAITSTGYQSSQQNSILGLASFFDHKEDVKIAIISDNLHEGAFKDLVSICSKEKMDFLDQEIEANIHSFYGHFDFIDLNILLEVSNDSSINGYDEVFDQIVDLYDIVFWDVPELHKIQKDSERYFPVIMKFESLSIIVAQSLTSSKHLEEVRLFFLGYGINLKGLLLDNKQADVEDEDEQQNLKKESKKKPWWRFF